VWLVMENLVLRFQLQVRDYLNSGYIVGIHDRIETMFLST